MVRASLFLKPRILNIVTAQTMSLSRSLVTMTQSLYTTSAPCRIRCTTWTCSASRSRRLFSDMISPRGSEHGIRLGRKTTTAYRTLDGSHQTQWSLAAVMVRHLFTSYTCRFIDNAALGVLRRWDIRMATEDALSEPLAQLNTAVASMSFGTKDGHYCPSIVA